MPNQPVNKEPISKLFGEIQRRFPHLGMKFQFNHPEVDLNLDIPKQVGLEFDVNVNLQGDELHLSAGHFWMEWFPCTNPRVIEKWREAVYGVLSGEFRIIEYYRGRRAVEAELQCPDAQGWKRIARSAHVSFFLPWPWHVTTRELRNA